MVQAFEFLLNIVASHTATVLLVSTLLPRYIKSGTLSGTLYFKNATIIRFTNCTAMFNLNQYTFYKRLYNHLIKQMG